MGGEGGRKGGEIKGGKGGWGERQKDGGKGKQKGLCACRGGGG